MNNFIFCKKSSCKKIIFLAVSALFITTIQAQCTSGDCINGEGTFIYFDGSKFQGTFVNGKKFYGNYIYKSNAVYEGYFKNDERDSIGKYRYANGDFFEGYFKNDEKLYGTYSYKNGNEYIGSFFNNKPDGFGELRLSNGLKKEGFWNQGVPDWSILADSIPLNEEQSYDLESDGLSKGNFKNVNPRIFALVVGVSDYYGTEADLRYADSDAKFFYNHLKTAFSKEIYNGDCKLLLHHQATASNINTQLANIFSKATENDYIIFYFSGHGNKGVIIPSDIPNQVNYSDVKARLDIAIADAKKWTRKNSRVKL
jgi:hypothetical protein